MVDRRQLDEEAEMKNRSNSWDTILRLASDRGGGTLLLPYANWRDGQKVSK